MFYVSRFRPRSSDKDHDDRKMSPPRGGCAGSGFCFTHFPGECMLSRRFFAWVGVGVISAATIPTLAAPQLAKLASRKPPAKTTTATKTTAKAAAASKLSAGAKTTAKAPVKTALKTSIKPAAKSAAL